VIPTEHRAAIDKIITEEVESQSARSPEDFGQKIASRIVNYMMGGRFYGGEGTIHGTSCVNVETHDGKVVSVWFRCQGLPYDQTEVDVNRSMEMTRMYSHPSALAMKMNGVVMEK
jgi:hypothetical protein